MARIVELIYTTKRVGMGKTEDDPVRIVHQWYDKKGHLVFEKDNMSDTYGTGDKDD